MIPGKQQRPGGGTQALQNVTDDTNNVARTNDNRAQPVAQDFLEQLTLRAVVDALASATRTYWERRADVLEAARPRPGEFHGQATREALNSRWERLTADAQACRAHATLFDHDAVDADLVADVLGWGRA